MVAPAFGFSIRLKLPKMPTQNWKWMFWKITGIKVNVCLIFFQSLKPSAHLFTQLSKVLKLSKVQEVRDDSAVRSINHLTQRQNGHTGIFLAKNWAMELDPGTADSSTVQSVHGPGHSTTKPKTYTQGVVHSSTKSVYSDNLHTHLVCKQVLQFFPTPSVIYCSSLSFIRALHCQQN